MKHFSFLCTWSLPNPEILRLPYLLGRNYIRSSSLATRQWDFRDFGYAFHSQRKTPPDIWSWHRHKHWRPWTPIGQEEKSHRARLRPPRPLAQDFVLKGQNLFLFPLLTVACKDDAIIHYLPSPLLFRLRGLLSKTNLSPQKLPNTAFCIDSAFFSIPASNSPNFQNTSGLLCTHKG